MKPVVVATIALVVLVSCMSVGLKKPRRFSENDILQQLDSAFTNMHKEYGYEDAMKTINSRPKDIHYTFMLDLEHGYCVTAGSRINLYADSTRWAIVFEKSGYENRAGDAEIELDYFGNCIKPNIKERDGYTIYSNATFIPLISEAAFEKIRNKNGNDAETFEKISPDAPVVKIRNQMVSIEHDLAKYLKAGVVPDSSENPRHLIGYGDLVRYFNETSPLLIQATDGEIRKYIPANLPKIMSIDNFHFESIYDKKNLPGKQETYQMIARILAKRDSTLWKPKQKPNNHWSNWASGNL